MPATLEQPAPSFGDVWRMFQETDRQMKETDRQIKERFAETERLMKERADENDKIIKNLSKSLGELGNRLGEFVEHMVAPAVVRLFQSQGIAVHEVHPSVEVNRDGEGIEIDLLVVNDGSLVAVECKSKLSQAHVDEHLARMEKLKRMLPAYRHHQASGAVAAMVMSNAVKAYAHSQGLYVLVQNGESVEVSSPPIGFSPRIW